MRALRRALVWCGDVGHRRYPVVMRSARVNGRTSRSRRGFSIVELLVALVLLTVGLLGVAGNGALAVRITGAATRERRGTQRASDRIAILTAQGCAAARGGSLVDAAAALTERWTVGPSGNGVTLVDAEVRWTTPTGMRRVLLQSAILC